MKRVLSVLCLSIAPLILSSGTLANIQINAGQTLRQASPFVYGGQQVAWNTGSGALQNRWGAVVYPTVFNPYLITTARQLPLATMRLHGDLYYNWRASVGPVQDRPGVRSYHLNRTIASNAYGPDEFIALCRMINAEPVVGAPYLLTTPDEITSDSPIAFQSAANFVEYMNAPSPGLAYGRQQGWEPVRWSNPPGNLAPWESGKSYSKGSSVRAQNVIFTALQTHTSSHASSPGNGPDWRDYWEWKPRTEIATPGKSWASWQKAPDGYFAWLREYFGNREPYRVKYWEIGNEVWAWVPNNFARPQNYAANAVRMIDMMKAVDPAIQCGLTMPGPDVDDPFTYQRQVLGTPGNYTEAYNKADFLIWHLSIGPETPNPANPAAEYKELFDELARIEQLHKQLLADYDKPVWVTEFNTRYRPWSATNPDIVRNQNRLKSGLAMAVLLNQFHRVGIFGGHYLGFGEFGAWFRTEAHRMVFEDVGPNGQPRKGVTPAYLAMQLFSKYGRGNVIATTVTGQPNLDALAYQDPQTGRISLFVVNKSHTQAITCKVNFTGFTPGGQIKTHLLTSEDGMEASNEERPGSVATVTTTSPYTAGANIKFERHSLTVIEFEPVAETAAAGGALRLTASADKADPGPGDTITYTITCLNEGAAPIASARVEFPLPAGVDYVAGSVSGGGAYSGAHRTVSWNLTALAPNTPLNLSFQAKVR